MKFKCVLMATLTALLINGCDNNSNTSPSEEKQQAADTQSAKPAVSLDEVLAAQSQENKARYAARHPKETLEFLGIKPGMIVVEVLPGGGWYSKILLPYLGDQGHLIGADYALDMFPKFGFFSQEELEAKRAWVQTWMNEAQDWRGGMGGARLSAFQLGRMPQNMEGTADAVLFIRALHNLARFENDGGYLTSALADAYKVLKPGGIVAVVQHMAPEDASDDWADGSNGYLKKSFVIARLQKAGFEYVDSSDINLNPADQPSEEELVWRLPPSLSTSKKDPELKEKYLAIGESNRMTLKFRKPAEARR